MPAPILKVVDLVICEAVRVGKEAGLEHALPRLLCAHGKLVGQQLSTHALQSHLHFSTILIHRTAADQDIHRAKMPCDTTLMQHDGVLSMTQLLCLAFWIMYIYRAQLLPLLAVHHFHPNYRAIGSARKGPPPTKSLAEPSLTPPDIYIIHTSPPRRSKATLGLQSSNRNWSHG